MVGRTISHYRVLSTLGRGGMGVVYLAQDERLRRQVALKFLPPHVDVDEVLLERFRIEARAASSLSHPGICTVFDIGDDEGTPYIVMEAVKGESLRDRINRGPMKVAEVLDLAMQLADALEAAHSQGIVHRDIKPSNIIVAEKNRAKILDFGLAKLGLPFGVGDAQRDANTRLIDQLTVPGSTLGTFSYMSPEQARGEDVDGRADLFSLGTVMYEMVTGTQAFGGSTPAVVFDAILNRTPPVIVERHPLVPPRLESIIRTTLEKDPDLRYQHAADLQADLRRLRRDLDSNSHVAAASVSRVSQPVTESAPPVAASAASPRPTPADARRTAAWRYAAVAIGVAAAAVVVSLVWRGRSAPQDTGTPAGVERAAQPSPSRLPEPEPARIDAAPRTPASLAAVPPAVPSASPSDRSATPTARPDSTQHRASALSTGEQPIPPPAGPAGSPTAPSTVTPGASQAALPPPPVPASEPPPAPLLPATPAATDTTATLPPVVQPTPRASAAPAPPPSPAPRAAAPEPPPSSPALPSSPVETDEAAIRRTIATFQAAIEKKDLALYRSVRPGLSAAEEARLRDSFRQNDSQQVAITIDEIRVEGRAATVRVSRQDAIVIAGRKQTQSSRQTLRLEKAGTSWTIIDLR
jgi:serine/threonine protein kinase